MAAAHEPTSRRVVARLPAPGVVPILGGLASYVDTSRAHGPGAPAIPHGVPQRVGQTTEHSGVHDQPRPRRRNPLPEDIELALTNLEEDVFQLTLAIDAAESRIAGASYAPAVEVLVATVADRLSYARAVRDSLASIHVMALHPGARKLLENDAPLPPFLKGTVIWCDGVIDALKTLAVELEALDADWLGFRKRVDDASRFLFAGLVVQVRAHVVALRDDVHHDALRSVRVADMSDLLEQLFASIRRLNVALKKIE